MSPSTQKFAFTATATQLTLVKPESCSPGCVSGLQLHRGQRPRTPPRGYEYCPPWPPTPEWMKKDTGAQKSEEEIPASKDTAPHPESTLRLSQKGPSRRSERLATKRRKVEESAALPMSANILAKKKKGGPSKGNKKSGKKKGKGKSRPAPEEQENCPSEPPRKRQKTRK